MLISRLAPLTSWSGFDDSTPFVGLANYVKAFSDDDFVQAVQNSVTLVLVLPNRRTRMQS